MESHGFVLAETGGGCTAFTRVALDGTVWLITRAGDVDAPTTMTEAITIGQYPDEGEPLFSTVENLETALHSPLMSWTRPLP